MFSFSKQGDQGGPLICKVGGKPDVLIGIGSDININEDCSKYGWGRPGIFTSVQKLRDWIQLTLNNIKSYDERSNDSNINRPMFFVILLMIGSVFFENK